jgi:Glycosyl hydrolase family 26
MSLRSFAVLIAACCTVPAATAQYTYGRYLEPPTGKVLQGIGQYTSENAGYITLLSGSNLPATKAITGNIGAFCAHSAPTVSMILSSLNSVGTGVMPQIDMQMRDFGVASSTSPYMPITIDDALAAGSTYVTPYNSVTYDLQAQIDDWGQALVSYGKPCMMRIGFEFNNNAGYHAYDYVTAYRKIVDGIRAQGATRVAFVWCWEPSGPADYLDVDMTLGPKWYPGDSYVDWWGIDMFTYSTYFATGGAFTAKAAAFLAAADSHGYPVAAQEVSPGTLDILPDGPGENGATCVSTWFTPFFAWLAANPGVKQFAWINHDYDVGGSVLGFHTHLLQINTIVFNYWTGQISDAKYLSAGELDQLNGYHGWYGLGNDLAGTSGSPLLTGDGEVVASGSITITLTGAAPSAAAGLIIGLSRIDAPFKGGVLVPNVDVQVNLTTSSTGGIAIPTTWLSTATTGFTTYYQYWVVDSGGPHGYSASNALMAITL